MSRYFDTREPAQFEAGIAAAVTAARSGELVVVATESAYAVAADAFRSDGLDRIRQVKGRDRSLPLPVLIGSRHTVSGVTAALSDAGQALIEQFWPGMLTIVARAQPALAWDVGGIDRQFVSVRLPIHQVAWKLAHELGPMAATAANRMGETAPRTCTEAEEQLGAAVAVYLDSGRCDAPVGSTVVDVTRDPVSLVRLGAVSVEQLTQITPVSVRIARGS